MKTKGITFIAMLLFLSGCTGKMKNDWDNLYLKGKVKQIIELQYEALVKFGKPVKGKLYREEGWDRIIDFNEKGYYSKITYQDSYGQTVGSTDYLYTPKGLLNVEQNYDAEGSFTDKNQYFYDKEGKVTEVMSFNNIGSSTGRKVIQHDEKANTVTISTYNFNGDLILKEEQQLDKNGFPTETKIYNAEDVLVNHRKDAFNKDGLRQKMTVLMDENVFMNVFFKYDKNNNLISQEGVDENGENFLPQHYEYVFDKKGNWIQRIEYEDKKPISIVERDIEYFNE